MEIINETDFYSDGIREKWNIILSKNQVHDIGQTHEYCVLWWKIYKDNIHNKSLLVIVDTFCTPSEIWPLMIRKQYLQNGLHIIGQIDGYITDYAFPILIDINSFTKELSKLVNFLKLSKINWNYLKINIPEWTEYKSVKNLSINKKSHLLTFTKIYDHYSFVNLCQNFEWFISSLGTRTRADLRKYLRIFEKNEFSFEVLRGPEIEDRFYDLIKLNSQVWYIFKDEKQLNKKFLETLVKADFKNINGELILPVLYYKGKPIALILGYISNMTCFLHTAGIQRNKIESLSPGMTLYMLIIRYLYENGIKILDLSPGIEEYKLRLGAQLKTINQMVVFKNYYSMIIYKAGFYCLRGFQFIKKHINFNKLLFY